MKKYILLAISAFALVNTQAQTISFTPKSLTVAGANDDDFKANFGITNNSTDSTDTQFTWTFLNFSKPFAWQINLCDPFECLYDVDAGETHTFTLEVGKVGLFYGDFIPNGVDGTSNLTVVVKSTKNPANADTATMTAVAWVTSVNEVAGKTISFGPNPVKEQFTLKFESSQHISVDVYNVLGTKVKSFVHNGTSSQVSVSELQNGVYFVRFMENGKLYTKQFVKTN